SKFNISSVSADQPEVLSKPFQEEIIEALLNVVNDGMKIDDGKKTVMKCQVQIQIEQLNAIGGDGEGENDCLLSELE
ncbi:MAG: hypothetical protein EZS28_035576, partial [Streblomastix strix]